MSRSEIMLTLLSGRSCVLPDSSADDSRVAGVSASKQTEGEMGNYKVLQSSVNVKGSLSTKRVPPKPILEFNSQRSEETTCNCTREIFWRSDVSSFLTDWETETFRKKSNTEVQSSSRGQSWDKVRVLGTKGPSGERTVGHMYHKPGERFLILPQLGFPSFPQNWNGRIHPRVRAATLFSF